MIVGVLLLVLSIDLFHSWLYRLTDEDDSTAPVITRNITLALLAIIIVIILLAKDHDAYQSFRFFCEDVQSGDIVLSNDLGQIWLYGNLSADDLGIQSAASLEEANTLVCVLYNDRVTRNCSDSGRIIVQREYVVRVIDLETYQLRTEIEVGGDTTPDCPSVWTGGRQETRLYSDYPTVSEVRHWLSFRLPGWPTNAE